MNLIGIYYPERSFWHELDPRSKMAVVLATMLILIASQGIELGWLGIITILLYLTSKLPVRLIWGVVDKFKWLLFIPFMINLIVPFQDNWHLTLTGNFQSALYILIRLAVIMLVATWLSYVTKPMMLVEGITRLFKPWARSGSGMDIPLMMGLVVRFVPELLQESENILIAQRIRGIKPGFKFKNSSGWIKSTIIPLFLASIRKAAALAIAMEARGYRPGIQRSSIEELKLKTADYLVIGISILIVVWQVW